MNSVTLQRIQEIYHLWKPVYPYLAQHVLQYYARQDGDILEIGPFCGLLFVLSEMKIGTSLSIATFPPEMVEFFRKETKNRRAEGNIGVIEIDSSLTGFEENSIDLAIFRGAFFFPSLFKVEVSRIYNILRPGGVAFVGGGFGKFTPDFIIEEIGKRSRDLNLQIGKVEIRKEEIWHEVETLSRKEKIELLSEGGIWLVMKK